MAIMTPQQYLDSHKEVQPRVYVHGELVEDLHGHPMVQPSVNSMKLTYSVRIQGVRQKTGQD